MSSPPIPLKLPLTDRTWQPTLACCTHTHRDPSQGSQAKQFVDSFPRNAEFLRWEPQFPHFKRWYHANYQMDAVPLQAPLVGNSLESTVRGPLCSVQPGQPHLAALSRRRLKLAETQDVQHRSLEHLVHPCDLSTQWQSD